MCRQIFLAGRQKHAAKVIRKGLRNFHITLYIRSIFSKVENTPRIGSRWTSILMHGFSPVYRGYAVRMKSWECVKLIASCEQHLGVPPVCTVVAICRIFCFFRFRPVASIVANSALVEYSWTCPSNYSSLVYFKTPKRTDLYREPFYHSLSVLDQLKI